MFDGIDTAQGLIWSARENRSTPNQVINPDSQVHGSLPNLQAIIPHNHIAPLTILPKTRNQKLKTNNQSVFQWQGNGFAVAGRKIGGDDDFQTLQTFPPVGFRLGHAAQGVDDIFIVKWMAEPID